ncbi:MAG: hypothetical protein MK082_10455 [Phycisphaerales bacterium]|nr:hypothetical protein [Phycisphaerales bacterium]
MNLPEDHILRKTVENARTHYEGFSRSTRTLVIVGAVSLLILAVLESWTAAEAYDKQTEALLTNMSTARATKTQLRPSFRDRVLSLGTIRLPEASLEPTAAERNLKLAVDQILAKYGAENEKTDLGPGAAIAANRLPEIPRAPGRRLTKISLRIEFDCAQDNAPSVISALESSPEVYTITRLQIRRYEDGQEQVRKLVNVNLTLETWALSKSRLGGRG